MKRYSLNGLPSGYLLRQYENWLRRWVGAGKEYRRLFHLLAAYKYTYSIEQDKNRAIDGLYYTRAKFLLDKAGLDIYKHLEDHECSVLEMLIAFASRIDSDFLQNRRVTPGDIIFWEMLNNLGINLRDDEYSLDKVAPRLQVWLARKYEPNGVGSPFPMKHPKSDMRKMELWNMMTAYVQENYA